MSATITLDDYEVANLTAALRAIAGHKNDASYNWDEQEWRSPLGAPWRSPLGALNTGDWVCQILFKLPPTAHAPNKAPEQARADARAFAAELEAENARLREALRPFAYPATDPDDQGCFMVMSNDVNRAREILG